jgi:hypothetical protein
VAAVADPPRAPETDAGDDRTVAVDWPLDVEAWLDRAPLPEPERPVEPVERAWTCAAFWPALRDTLVVSWLAISVSVFFEPAPNPNVAVPWWSWALFYAFVAVLVSAAVLGARGRWRPGLGCATAAGAIGLVIAYECAATSHHARGWWIYELAAFAYLTVLSAGSLVVRARAENR